MARAALHYIFAALLALLSTQAVVPVRRADAAIEIAWCRDAEQQTPSEVLSTQPTIAARQSPPVYASHTRLAPDAAVLFQRPPPSLSLFA